MVDEFIFDSVLIRPRNGLCQNLQAIAAQKKIKFIIEGHVLNSSVSLSGKSDSNIKSSIDNMKKTVDLKILIQELAFLYDYDCDFSLSGEYFILVKKYINVIDFPDVSSEEIQHFYHNMEKISKHVAGVFGSDSNATMNANLDFFRSLTPDLRQKMRRMLFLKSDDKMTELELKSLEIPDELHKIPYGGVSFNNLSTAQQEYISNVALYKYLGEKNQYFSRGLKCFDGICKADTYFTRKNFAGYRDVLTGVYLYSGKKYEFCWSPLSRINFDFGSSGISTAKELSLVVFKDEFDPLPQDYIGNMPKKIPYEDGFDACSVREILNKVIAKNGNHIEIGETPEGILNKRITFIGDSDIEFSIFEKTIKRIFNLSAKIENEKLTISYPRIHQLQGIRHVPNVIREIFPGAYLRLCQACAIQGYELTQKTRNARLEERGVSEPILKQKIAAEPTLKSGDEWIYIKEQLDKIRKQAIRRCRIVIEKTMEESKDGIAKWDDFPYQEKQLIGFIFSCDALPYAFQMLEQVSPWYINQLSSCRIGGDIRIMGNICVIKVVFFPPDGSRTSATYEAISHIQ